MSGWQAQQERRKMNAKNSLAALDRRTKLMLEIEHTLAGRSWMLPEPLKFALHPGRKAVILLSGKLTPILREFVDNGKIFVEEEFFPRQRIHNILLLLPQKITEEPKRPPRAVDL
jgi:hypothetical protein